MAISSTGSVSYSQVRNEYVAASGSVSASQLYRGGTYVKGNAADNLSTNLAASVPTTGTITADNFRGTAKGFRYTYTADATDQNISALFGDDYDLDYPKEVVIDSGVELGATSTTEEALEADTANGGLVGTLTITNNGTITGRGGAAGADGGDAFEANVTCTFVNNGTVRAGGGGGGAGGAGGRGGTGGQGRTSYTYYTYSGDQGFNNQYQWNVTTYTYSAQYFLAIRWGGNWVQSQYNNATGSPSWGNVTSVVGGQYQRRGQVGSTVANYGLQNWQYKIRRRYTNTGYNYYSGGSGGYGGAGGAGGIGAGYQQTAGTGGSGVGGQSGNGGQTNAGTGGTGGTGGVGGAGGTFGAAGTNGSTGNTGATGASGNYTGGSGGQAGSGGSSAGAAGKYLRGASNVTFTNNGTVQGGTA